MWAQLCCVALYRIVWWSQLSCSATCTTMIFFLSHLCYSSLTCSWLLFYVNLGAFQSCLPFLLLGFHDKSIHVFPSSVGFLWLCLCVSLLLRLIYVFDSLLSQFFFPLLPYAVTESVSEKNFKILVTASLNCKLVVFQIFCSFAQTITEPSEWATVGCLFSFKLFSLVLTMKHMLL